MNALAPKTETLPLAPVPSVASSPMLSLLSDAIQKGMPIEVIREIKGMAQEMAADEARRAFDAALSDAKAEIPVITKNRKVGYEHKTGDGSTEYWHEDMGQIARIVAPILSKHGLSYRFKTESKLNEPVVVTCIIAHRAGHFEENTLSAGRDDSGKKNSLQAIASTITYLQRYTLKAALGLAAAADDDAKTSEQPETITDEQAAELNELIEVAVEQLGNTTIERHRAAFLTHMRVEQLSDIRSRDFRRAVAAINSTRPRK